MDGLDATCPNFARTCDDWRMFAEFDYGLERCLSNDCMCGPRVEARCASDLGKTECQVFPLVLDLDISQYATRVVQARLRECEICEWPETKQKQNEQNPNDPVLLREGPLLLGSCGR